MAKAMVARLTPKQVCAYCVRTMVTASMAAFFYYCFTLSPVVQRASDAFQLPHAHVNTEGWSYLRKDYCKKLKLQSFPEALKQNSEILPTLEQFLNRRNAACNERKNTRTHNGG